MELHPLQLIFYTAGQFRFLSTEDFRVGKQVRVGKRANFLVVKGISTFFQSLRKFLRDDTCVEQKLSADALFCLDFCLCSKRCPVTRCLAVTFLNDFIIQCLMNTGCWLLVFCPDRSVFINIQMSTYFQSLISIKILCIVP